MNIASLALKGFPLLHLEDTASIALQHMDEFDVQELPVVKDDYFVGLVQKENLLDIDERNTIASISEDLLRVGINGSAHLLNALDVIASHHISLLPVLNDHQEVMGVIPQKNIIEHLAQYLGVHQPGAILVLSISPYHYSLAELSRLVESNNGQILQMNTVFDETSGLLRITIKINKEEIEAILATLQRYNYEVVHYFTKSPLVNDIEHHYHHLMNYLDV